MEYNYFISYYGVKNGKDSIGDCTITRDEEIRICDDIKEIRKAIKERNLFDDVVIINFIKLGG